ncbi:MAG: SIS domain-containing protein [Muribaculaceae bacterium]|nr:SIS domain-containing protein [Muribaculaceae bacterium]
MTKFLLEILEQPAAITKTSAYYEQAKGAEILDRMADALRNAPQVIATGMGSSYFLAGAISTLLASRGVSITPLNAGELLHYGLDSIRDGAMLIAISQSGESFETVNIVKRLSENGVKFTLATITNEPDSYLGKKADILLPTIAGREEKTSTKTFITAYQVIYMIASCLAGAIVPPEQWDRISASIAKTLDQREALLPSMLSSLGDATYLQLIARGSAMAAASQSALMAMEASHTPSQAMAGGEFRHGPLEMVQPGFAAVILAHSGSATFGQLMKLTNDILGFGGRVLLVTDSADAVVPRSGLTIVAVDAPSNPELFAIPAIIPVQIALEAWAREAKGIIPGEFTHGAKVTSVE